LFGAEFRHDPTRAVDKLLLLLAPYFESEPLLNSIQAELLLRRIYAEWGGLLTVAQLTNAPASLVAYRQAEDATFGSLKEDHFDHFLDLEIFEATGITWPEYISLPRSEIDMIRDRVKKRRDRKNNADNKSVEEAERLAKQISQGS